MAKSIRFLVIGRLQNRCSDAVFCFVVVVVVVVFFFWGGGG